MADVAARLRAAREKAGLSIEDLSARTKIKHSVLVAMEQGAFEQILGGEFFTRAFLRTYARELHLPTDELMADYDRARPVPVMVQAPQPSSSHPWVGLRSARDRWSLGAVAVAGLLVLFAAIRSAPAPDTELHPVRTTGSSARVAPPQPQPTTGPAPPELLTIAIRPTRRLWVTGTVDGKRVLFRMLAAGEEVTLSGRERMAFMLGDAGAFEYAINGVPGKPPGRNGEVRELVIDRSNYRELTR